jgi:hypothetical protein
MTENVDKLFDLVDMHPRNGLNMCILGGMHELISLGLGFPSEIVRQKALSLVAIVC